MPRTCTVCRHARRTVAERLHLDGASNRIISNQIPELSVQSLQRHWKHIPGRLIKAKAVKEVARADDLLDRVVALRERLERALNTARRPMDVAHLSRETRETLRLLLELEGRLKSGTQVQVNIVQAPPFIAFQEWLLETLRQHPDARTAVIEGAKRLLDVPRR